MIVRKISDHYDEQNICESNDDDMLDIPLWKVDCSLEC